MMHIYSDARDGYSPQQQECDVEEDDHDQQKELVPYSKPVDPLPTNVVSLPLGTHQNNMWCYFLMVQNLNGFQRKRKMRTRMSGISLCKKRWIPCITIILMSS
jgi:hypothetical protein